MSLKKYRTIVLCEDNEHGTFGRILLEELGAKRARVKRSPQHRGGGFPWVRAQYPIEVREQRRLGEKKVLLVMIDADTRTLDEEHRYLAEALAAASVEARTGGEAIALLIPKRAIETWIAALDGIDVNETDSYPRAPVTRDYVRRFIERCRAQQASPSSLIRACGELQRLLTLPD